MGDPGFILDLSRYGLGMAHLLQGYQGVRHGLAGIGADRLRVELARRAADDARHALTAGRGDPVAVVAALAAVCRTPAPAKGTGTRVRAEIARRSEASRRGRGS